MTEDIRETIKKQLLEQIKNSESVPSKVTGGESLHVTIVNFKVFIEALALEDEYGLRTTEDDFTVDEKGRGRYRGKLIGKSEEH